MNQEVQIIKCYFDGSCEPYNPGGNMGIGVIAFIDKKPVFRHSWHERAAPFNSNNVAEYMALEVLLDRMLLLPENKYWIQIHGDSKLVVKQMNGQWKIKRGLYAEYAKRCKDKFRALKKRNELRIDWVSREYNKCADELSKSN